MVGAAGFGEEIALTLTARTATLTNSLRLRMQGARGILAVVHVKSVTTGTGRLSVSGIEPFAGNAFGINAATTFAAPGDYVYMIHPGAAKQPSGEAAATSHANLFMHVGIVVPELFLLSLVKSDASSWEYGVSFRRLR